MQLATHFATPLPGQRLPELEKLEQLIATAPRGVEVRTVCKVEAGAERLPVYAICLGNPDRNAPAIGFFGGVHGLERIGTHVLLHFLEDVLSRLDTDSGLRKRLENLRLVFMPLVNPGGMLRTTRSNPGGVDLMRNGPIEAVSKVPFMVGGQRWSRKLPWFRGDVQNGMEPESQALCQLVEDELLDRPFSAAIDCHSGFGFRDRIWFPYAHTPEPIHHLPEIHALTSLFDQQHPRHSYVIEPQSRQYLTHGDLWDVLYKKSLAERSNIFLPLTLEMGSWRWVRKYPRQLFTRLGMFNPLPADRRERVVRHHLPWFDFLTNMGGTWNDWLPKGEIRAMHAQRAHARWYHQH